ncbi:MAG: IS21 family transposase [Chloroflexi bacterium]|nr:MAG: IS21 family transposase [Chloroflexota bacterium]
MTATDTQVRISMRERLQGKSQEQAAAKANLRSRKTVAKYERLRQLPSQRKQRRSYRTRRDPFAADWPQAEALLAGAPELEAKTLFDWLCEQAPGKYQAGQLRTFQRRVATWRALHQAQVAVLEQVHRPGEVLQTDGVWLTELGVTIQGQPLAHLFIHSVLPYSNWEWGCLAQSESLAALQLGLQATLSRLAAVPRFHQTDNSSAATQNVSASDSTTPQAQRGYTEGYLHLLAHYGLEPRLTHRQAPQENGDVESLHGGFKQALTQHLLLRGRRDFDSLTAYSLFIEGVLTQRNAARQVRLAEELAVMKSLTVAPLAAVRSYRVRVSRNSLIRIERNHYSLPTSLIGCLVNVQVHEWHLDVGYGSQTVLTLPRLRGHGQQQINYRHLVDSLLRKPGGFRDYRYREALFPRLVFRQAWERLNRWLSPRRADLAYLRILRLAAQTLESDVAAALAQLLPCAEPWDETAVEALLPRRVPPVPEVQRGVVSLAAYDQLLQEGPYVRH